MQFSNYYWTSNNNYKTQQSGQGYGQRCCNVWKYLTNLPPCMVIMYFTVTNVTTITTLVIMVVIHDSKKSFTPSLKKDWSGIDICVNMGNNMSVEQWVTPHVYSQFLKEAVNVRVQCTIDQKKSVWLRCVYIAAKSSPTNLGLSTTVGKDVMQVLWFLVTK